MRINVFFVKKKRGRKEKFVDFYLKVEKRDDKKDLSAGQ